MRSFSVIILSLILLAGFALGGADALAQEKSTGEEHPTKQAEKEHPSKGKEEHPAKGKEHPAEHPTRQGSPITVDALAKAIEAYVAGEAKKHDGYFVFTDPEEKKELRLKLVKVHKKRLAHLGDDVYFACADFKTPDGVMYDLDIFMKGKSAEDLTFTKVMLHKKNGVPRYTWYEEDGVWKRKPVESPRE